MAYTVVEVNAWVLRCIFSESKILARQTAGEFTAVTTKSRLSKKSWHPAGTRSEHWVYQDRNGIEIATAHCYVAPTGRVSLPDPKTVKIGDLRYAINSDP